MTPIIGLRNSRVGKSVRIDAWRAQAARTVQPASGKAGAALAALMLVGLMLAAAAPAGAQTRDADLIRIRRGDHCLVCNLDYTHIKQVLIHKGRRVPLCAIHIETFRANPQDYFFKLQPQGALFQEEAIPAAGARRSWLWIGIWIFVGLLAAAVSTHIALRKGLPGFRWFFAGVVTNLIGLICVLFKSSTTAIKLPGRLGKIPLTAHPTTCPACLGKNHPSAVRCGTCGNALDPSGEAEVSRAGLN